MLHIAAGLLALAAPQAAPVDCADANHRAFDFWLGDWDVYGTGSNQRVARSKITKDAGECAIHEQYDQDAGPAGKKVDYHGRSYSVLNPRDGKWQQFYVDNGGYPRVLIGTIADGTMTFIGSPPKGRSRMMLRANPDGSVRQWGENSADEGMTWTPSFDLTYRKH